MLIFAMAVALLSGSDWFATGFQAQRESTILIVAEKDTGTDLEKVGAVPFLLGIKACKAIEEGVAAVHARDSLYRTVQQRLQLSGFRPTAEVQSSTPVPTVRYKRDCYLEHPTVTLALAQHATDWTVVIGESVKHFRVEAAATFSPIGDPSKADPFNENDRRHIADAVTQYVADEEKVLSSLIEHLRSRLQTK